MAGEMAQLLRALAALPEDVSSIPSIHMVATTVYNCSSKGSEPSFGFRKHAQRTDMRAGKIPIYIKQSKSKNFEKKTRNLKLIWEPQTVRPV